MVNDPAPVAMIQAPAWSQLPMCGSGDDDTAAGGQVASSVLDLAGRRMPPTSRSAGITGSRKISSQYLA